MVEPPNRPDSSSGGGGGGGGANVSRCHWLTVPTNRIRRAGWRATALVAANGCDLVVVRAEDPAPAAAAHYRRGTQS